MKKFFCGLLFSLIGAQLFSPLLFAQSETEETLSATLYDQHTNIPVIGAEITIGENEPVISDGYGVFPITAEDEGKTATITHRKYFKKTNIVFDEGKIFLRSKKLPLGAKNLDSIITDNIILNAGDGFEGTVDGGSEENILQSFFSGENGIILIVNRVIGVVGILFFIIVAIRYMFSAGDEGKMDEYKKQLIWIAVGLGVVSVAEFVGFQMFDAAEKDILSDDVIAPFSGKVRQIVRYLEYIVGGIFLFNGILTGYNMITTEQEDSVSQEKTFLINFLIGAIFILMAEVIVRIASLEDGIAGSQNVLIGEIGGIINFGLTFMAGACGLMLILSSLYYVISFGNEEQANRAKTGIIGSIIGLVIAFSSYVIAQFLII